MQRGAQTVLDVFWRTSTFFDKERRWTYGLGYNMAFSAVLQLVVSLVLAGIVASEWGNAMLSLLPSTVLQPVYIAFATLLWASFIALSLATWCEKSFKAPLVLIGSLLALTVVITVGLNYAGVFKPVWRSIWVFGSWLAWMTGAYVFLWYHASWFEDVLALSQYSWLASYPYIVVSSCIVLIQEGFRSTSLVWEVLSSLVGAAAIVHIVVATVMGVRERFDVSLLGGVIAGIIGPVLIFLCILLLVYAGVLLA